MKCECCGQEVPPNLTIEQYEARAIPRLKIIDSLAKRIGFDKFGWEETADGREYERLMKEQAADEYAAGV